MLNSFQFSCFGRTNIYFFLMYMYIHIFTYISTPIFSQEIIFDQTSLSCILHVSAFDFFHSLHVFFIHFKF